MTGAALSLLLSAATVWNLGPLTSDFPTMGPWWFPAHRLGCDAAGCVVTWLAPETGGLRLWSTDIGPTGPGLPSALPAIGGGANVEGLLVARGVRAFFYDVATSGGDTNIYVALTPAGAPLDNATLLAVAPQLGYPVWTAGALGEELAVISFTMQNAMGFNDVYFRRFALDGGLPDPAPIRLSTGGNHKMNAQAAYFGSGLFAVIWDDRFDTNQFDLFRAIVGEDGGTVASASVLDPQPEDEGAASLVNIDGGLLLARATYSTPIVVKFLTLSADGTTTPLPAMDLVGDQPSLSWHDDRLVVATVRADGGVQVDLIPWQAGPGPLVPLFTSGSSQDFDPFVARLDARRAVLAFASQLSDAGTELNVTVLGLGAKGETCIDDSACRDSPCIAGICQRPAPDAGVDAGTDAGMDAGMSFADGGPESSRRLLASCGCAQTGAGAWMLALLAALLRRRRPDLTSD
jgi:hypothetical protein